jgi:hypothetical protein
MTVLVMVFWALGCGVRLNSHSLSVSESVAKPSESGSGGNFGGGSSCSGAPPISATINKTWIVSGGTATISASGGTPPYSYSVVAGGGSFSGATYTIPNAVVEASI